MMESARVRTIGELEAEGDIVAIQDGNHGEKHPKSKDYVDEGIPFVMANNLGSGIVDLAGCSKISREQADQLRIGFARTGDVLLTHKGTVGNVAVLGEVEPYVMLTPQVTYYRVNEERLSGRFLAYAFREPVFQASMKSQAQQSTRPYIGVTAQRRLSIKWHPKPIQDMIVGLLRPYDDLIENNRRRIALLGDAARLLYREWFVHFRFPGHEHVKIVDGVPEGWDKLKVREVTAFISRGITPKYDEESAGLAVNQRCIRDSKVSLELARRQSKRVPDGKLIRKFDVLINSTGVGTLGRVAQNFHELENLTVDSHVTIVRPSSRVRPHLFGIAMLDKQGFIETLGRGATGQTELSRDDVGDIEFVLAPSPLQNEFEAYAEKIARQIYVLSSQSAELARARDLLLPRLMDGRLEVAA